MLYRSRKHHYVLPAISAAALVFALWSIAKADRTYPYAQPDQVVSKAEAKTIAASDTLRTGFLAAVGIVEPSSETIRIGVEKPGIVEQVFVKAGEHVSRGDPLFRLDSRLAQAELMRRRTDLSVVEARLSQTRARLPGLAAEVEAARGALLAAQAENDDAGDIVRIAGKLEPGSTISGREVMRRKNLQRTTEARLVEAQARYAQARANLALFDEMNGGASIAVEIAAIEHAKSTVNFAEEELEVRTIRAPINATVLQVNLRPGEYAQAELKSDALVALGVVDRLFVRVDIDEADMPRWRKAGSATALSRGVPLHSMKLSFVRQEQLVVPKRSLSGQAAERVDTRVMQVIYEIDPMGLTILPGQQLDIYIDVEKAELQANIVR